MKRLPACTQASLVGDSSPLCMPRASPKRLAYEHNHLYMYNCLRQHMMTAGEHRPTGRALQLQHLNIPGRRVSGQTAGLHTPPDAWARMCAGALAAVPHAFTQGAQEGRVRVAHHRCRRLLCACVESRPSVPQCKGKGMRGGAAWAVGDASPQVAGRADGAPTTSRSGRIRGMSPPCSPLDLFDPAVLPTPPQHCVCGHVCARVGGFAHRRDASHAPRTVWAA